MFIINHKIVENILINKEINLMGGGELSQNMTLDDTNGLVSKVDKNLRIAPILVISLLKTSRMFLRIKIPNVQQLSFFTSEMHLKFNLRV